MKQTLAFLIFLQVLAPGWSWSQTSQTQGFQISVTIPASVTLVNRNTNTVQASDRKTFPQVVQTQQLIRNGRALTVTSIVVR